MIWLFCLFAVARPLKRTLRNSYTMTDWETLTLTRMMIVLQSPTGAGACAFRSPARLPAAASTSRNPSVLPLSRTKKIRHVQQHIAETLGNHAGTRRSPNALRNDRASLAFCNRGAQCRKNEESHICAYTCLYVLIRAYMCLYVLICAYMSVSFSGLSSATESAYKCDQPQQLNQ
jgi:hypothetical protein